MIIAVIATAIITVSTMQSATAGPVPPGGSLSINNDCPDLVIILPDNPAPTLDCSAQVTNTGLVALAECLVFEPRSNTLIGPFNLEVGEMSSLLDFSSLVGAQDVADMTVMITVNVVCLDSGNNAIMDSALESIEVRSVDATVEKNSTPEEQSAPGIIDWDWTATNTSPDGTSELTVSCSGVSTLHDPENEDDLSVTLAWGETASNMWTESGLSGGEYENTIICTFTAENSETFERMATDSSTVLVNVDIDDDGIHDDVDSQPLVFSQFFTDGTSSGTITSGQQFLTITDVPGSGINIVATGPATVSACGVSSITFTTGEAKIICGSITIDMLSGSAVVVYTAVDGTIVTITLNQGDNVTYDEFNSGQITNNGLGEIIISINDGDPISITAGETLTIGESDKIVICHKGKNTISVSENAKSAHLAHGDTLGPCP